MLDDITKSIEDSEHRRKVLEALLVAATPNGNRLPTIEEFILSEVVNGTLEYVNAKAGEITYAKERAKHADPKTYESKLYAYYHEEMRNTEKLSENIRTAIGKLVEAVWHHPYPGDSYCDTDLHAQFKGFGGVGGICQVIAQSTFSLPHELVLKVQKEIMPSFSESERKDIMCIGEAMRKYIKEDLEYIQKQYHW